MVGRKEYRIWGIGAAPGIVEGKAYVLTRKKARFTKRFIHKTAVEKEVARINAAIEKSKEDLHKIKDVLANENIKDHVYILDSHLMIMEDPMLLEAVTEMITNEKKNAEWALSSAFENFKKMFDTIDNEYLKERKTDFDYLNNWILRHLSGRREESLQDINEKVIIVAHYLSPADTAQMDRNKVKGFITDIGGKTSHTAILARALKIPAVVGAEKATLDINTGDRIVMDGRGGLVVINPAQESVKQFRSREIQYGNLEKALLKGRNLPSKTLDNKKICLSANIEMVEEAPSVLDYGAEGIGLFRTEFLCLSQGKIPSEEEHFEVYKGIAEKMSPFSVDIRTFDFGSDKSPNINHISQEANPAMGLRSIRYCLKEIDIFRDQLRAILRASHYGKFRILFPMISGLTELRRAKEIYEEAKEDVKKKGQPFDPELELGIMVEVPSAAITADVLAEEVDFFSIGTNDLIQYSLAVDRDNKEVAYLYEPLHPSILRLLKHIVDSAKQNKIKVGMCGEMASDLRYIYMLLGLGFDQLSMVSSMVPWIKEIVRSVRYKDAVELVDKLLLGKDNQENEKILTEWIQEKNPSITQTMLFAY